VQLRLQCNQLQLNDSRKTPTESGRSDTGAGGRKLPADLTGCYCAQRRSDFFSASSHLLLGGFRLNASPGHPEVRVGDGVRPSPTMATTGKARELTLESPERWRLRRTRGERRVAAVGPILFPGAGGNFGTSPFRDPRPAALEPRTAKRVENALRRAGSEIEINGRLVFADSRATLPSKTSDVGPASGAVKSRGFFP
jgi:hypothetical protein